MQQLLQLQQAAGDVYVDDAHRAVHIDVEAVVAADIHVSRLVVVLIPAVVFASTEDAHIEVAFDWVTAGSHLPRMAVVLVPVVAVASCQREDVHIEVVVASVVAAGIPVPRLVIVQVPPVVVAPAESDQNADVVVVGVLVLAVAAVPVVVDVSDDLVGHEQTNNHSNRV